MEILVEDNTAQLDPKTWFLNTSPGVDSTDIVEVTVKGLAGFEVRISGVRIWRAEKKCLSSPTITAFAMISIS